MACYWFFLYPITTSDMVLQSVAVVTVLLCIAAEPKPVLWISVDVVCLIGYNFKHSHGLFVVG